MNTRGLLAAFAVGFLLVGLSGLWLAALLPQHASIGGALLAFVLGAGFAVLAFRRGGPVHACERCGAAADATLPFCARCGETRAPGRASA